MSIFFSYMTGIFPDNWKESLVIPIEKIKNTNKYEELGNGG